MASQPSTDHEGLVGDVLASRYRVVGCIGEGGMGVVYRAWDHQADCYVVVKLPRGQLSRNTDVVRRFEREMEAIRQMRHEAIVPVLDFGAWERRPYAVMPYLGGGSLERRQRRGGRPISVRSGTLRHWLPAVAAALDHVHAAGFVHRDVKPANILFDGLGRAFLGDFGIVACLERAGATGVGVDGLGTGPHAVATSWNEEAACVPFQGPQPSGITRAGHVVGTPEYMPPEVVAGGLLDGRGDQYALAVVVFEMLAGRPPITATTAAGTMIAQVTSRPACMTSLRPELPTSIAAAVRQALAKRPEDRFSSCREFAEVLLLEVPREAVPPPRLLCPCCGCMMEPPPGWAGGAGRCPHCRERLHVADDLMAVVNPRERLAASGGAVAGGIRGRS
jgi:serine/threonine protein kinase